MEKHNNLEKKYSDVSIEYLAVGSHQSISYYSFGTALPILQINQISF